MATYNCICFLNYNYNEVCSWRLVFRDQCAIGACQERFLWWRGFLLRTLRLSLKLSLLLEQLCLAWCQRVSDWSPGVRCSQWYMRRVACQLGHSGLSVLRSRHTDPRQMQLVVCSPKDFCFCPTRSQELVHRVIIIASVAQESSGFWSIRPETCWLPW